MEGLYDTDALKLTLPWLLDHVEEAWRVFGRDYWPYGVEANRPTWEAIGQYVFEQAWRHACQRRGNVPGGFA